MPNYYRVSELCTFTGLLTVCQPVMLPEWIQIWSWWLLCRSDVMIYVAAVLYPLWYTCIEEWKIQTTVFPSYRNMLIYLKLSTTSEVIWQHLLAYRVNMFQLENYVFLLPQVVHFSVHTSQIWRRLITFRLLLPFKTIPYL